MYFAVLQDIKRRSEQFQALLSLKIIRLFCSFDGLLQVSMYVDN